jgi:hypothetical protein
VHYSTRICDSNSSGVPCTSGVACVLDLVSQICDVVLVRSTYSSGKPQGVGILEWGGNGEGMGMGRSVYEQSGTKVDRILSQQGGFQVSKGKLKGGKKELEKGKAEARGLRHNCIVNLYACT